MGNPIRSYRDLVAWQRAFELGKQVHQLARTFPRDELFMLTSQTRRACTSVAMNIAEGYGRGTRAEYVRFLKIARGSLYEVDTALLFARDLSYINEEQYLPTEQLLRETERVLAGLIRSLEQSAD